MKRFIAITLVILCSFTAVSAQNNKKKPSNPVGVKVQKLKKVITANQLTILETDFAEALKYIETSEDEEEHLIVERKKVGVVYEVSISTLKKSEGGLKIELDTKENTLTITGGNAVENLIFVDKGMDGIVDSVAVNLKGPEDLKPDASEEEKKAYEKESNELSQVKSMIEQSKQKSYKLLISGLSILFDID